MKYLHLFTMLLITLKLLGFISISWWIVFAPSIVWAVIFIAMVIFVIKTGAYKNNLD